MPIFSDIFIFQVKCRVIKITTGPNPFTNSNQFFLKLLFKSQFSHIMVIWQVFNHQTFTGYFSNLLWSLLEMSSGTIHVQFVYNLRKFTNNLMPCFGLIDKKKQSSVIITSLIRTDTNQMKAKKWPWHDLHSSFLQYFFFLSFNTLIYIVAHLFLKFHCLFLAYPISDDLCGECLNVQ